ncbi:hypothetical protein DFH28DRAFT_1166737 [Melampsora americana]|nr:hypothetical protein DFH28DRAFT_1166737 [Melampsora americana]
MIVKEMVETAVDERNETDQRDEEITEKEEGKISESGSKKTTWENCAKALAGTEPPLSLKKSADHCPTKFTKVKGNFRSIKELTKCSGMGWCPVEMKCDTSPDVWKYLIEQDPSQAKWVNTPFPLFDKMESLVRKILASAEDTFDPTQATSAPVTR